MSPFCFFSTWKKSIFKPNRTNLLFITRVKLTNTSVSASKKNGARAFYGFLCYTTFFKQRRNLCSQKIKFSQWRHVEKMFVLNFGVKTLKKNNNNFSDPIQQLAFWQKMRNLHSLGEKTTLRNMWNVFSIWNLKILEN